MNERIQTCLDQQRWTEAFELVVAHYQTRVFHLALSILGSAAAAEDGAQESFLRIWRGLRGYRGASSLSTWIYAIARNTCLTMLQAAGNRATLSLEQPGIRAAAEARRAPPRAAADDLLELFSQLPDKYRQILTLFYLEERSYQQVAEILNLPMGTVKTNLHRARKEIADALMRANMTKRGPTCGKR